MEDKNAKYYQFNKEFNIPIFVKFDPDLFSEEIAALLLSAQFYELSSEEAKEIPKIIQKGEGSRILNIAPASPAVSRQIDLTIESDRFGHESITPKTGYKVYRYKGYGLMNYSYVVREWNLACFTDLAEEKNQLAFKIIMARYLSWALAPLGIVGFWGVPFDEGVVVLRKSDAFGKAVYIDIRERLLFSSEEVKTIGHRFEIMRLDSALKGRTIGMSREELFSFLSHTCVYFDYMGLTVPVRQMIQALAKTAVGLTYPREDFSAQTDLSL